MPIDPAWLASFQEKLDRHYTWPAVYTFKFIVPHGAEQQFRDLFPLHAISTKESKQGKYTSLTFEMTVSSSAAIVAVYEKASVVEGIIAL
ncbi:MAG: DUF493 domain-containing protein [Cyclobacteriaceae bacterium]|jgi:hypothetical protein|nr:DUF493 domain-containing protein [Cyclobacteriaceae bacterium]